MTDPYSTRATLQTRAGAVEICRLDRLETEGLGSISSLPISIRVLLESVLRSQDGFAITDDHVRALAAWGTGSPASEIPFLPARVVLQDFTGVPAVVDLAALRGAIARAGGNPMRVNPLIPADLVIDHSVQVDAFGSMAALLVNADREFERNRERYEFLHWGQRAFADFRVVPPASGIVHQVNLEYLASVVATRTVSGQTTAFPDSLVGTDSHTTMINGLGVLGWGVGGIEAEAVMLGQPVFMLAPEVVGFELVGRMPQGATATDLVLTATEQLRRHGVVGKFVEYFGDGLAGLSLADRATLANMSPEYGATVGLFPVDDETLRYLRATGRPPELVDLVERYTKEQGLFRGAGATPLRYTETLQLDLSAIEPSLAGPRRPQDRIALAGAKAAFHESMATTFAHVRRPAAPAAVERMAAEGPPPTDDSTGMPVESAPVQPAASRNGLRRVRVELEGASVTLADGSVVIAAITSCTNTSNPTVMVAAGLLAKRAVELGLDRKPWVKTSMAPGSRVVTRYLDAAGLMPYLQALGFHVVGYGCTTCIGNSGPLPEAVSDAVAANNLVVAAVLSGNRNFEGRINPDVRANYLASPPLVVAYAIAGTMDLDLVTEPIGRDPNGRAVFLSDIWPSNEEVAAAVTACLDPEMFRSEYANIFRGGDAWNAISSGESMLFGWQPDSTYVREPPFFMDIGKDEPGHRPVVGGRCLVFLGDSVTTDHISPAGAIARDSAAGRYLMDQGIEPREFNSYGSRRGNHEVMMRGTFGNVRLRNGLAPDTEGAWTRHLPSDEMLTIYDAAMRYSREGVPLLVIAGSEYGTGSSRDWAAKGPALLGVKVVIAKSYERIHRSNLIGMGILPVEFMDGQDAVSLGIRGDETFDVEIPSHLSPKQELVVGVTDAEGRRREFAVRTRVDTPIEVRYLANGGILHTVLRSMLADPGP